MWPWIAWMNEWMVSLSPLHLCSNFKVYFLPHYANYILLIVEKVIVICFHLWERPQKLYTLPTKMWCLFWTNYIPLINENDFVLPNCIPYIFNPNYKPAGFDAVRAMILIIWWICGKSNQTTNNFIDYK